MSASDDSPDASPELPQRVGDIAELYLGNILYALERTAMALDAESKGDEATFYRGIGRALADAHGRTRAR